MKFSNYTILASNILVTTGLTYFTQFTQGKPPSFCLCRLQASRREDNLDANSYFHGSSTRGCLQPKYVSRISEIKRCIATPTESKPHKFFSIPVSFLFRKLDNKNFTNYQQLLALRQLLCK